MLHRPPTLSSASRHSYLDPCLPTSTSPLLPSTLPCSLQPQPRSPEDTFSGWGNPLGRARLGRGEGKGASGLLLSPHPAPAPAGSCSRASAEPHCYAPHIPSPSRAAARQELGLQRQLGVARVASLLVQAAGSNLSPLKTPHPLGPRPGSAPPSSCSFFCLLAPSNPHRSLLVSFPPSSCSSLGLLLILAG